MNDQFRDRPEGGVERRVRHRRTEDNFMFQPARRIYVLLIAIVLIIAMTVAWFGLQSYFSRVDVKICQRSNAVRHEMNVRIPEHKKNSGDLEQLLLVTTQTREREEKAWIAIHSLFSHNANLKGLDKDINNLIFALDQARRQDFQIYLSEKTVRFNNLPLIDCSKGV